MPTDAELRILTHLTHVTHKQSNINDFVFSQPWSNLNSGLVYLFIFACYAALKNPIPSWSYWIAFNTVTQKIHNFKLLKQNSNNN